VTAEQRLDSLFRFDQQYIDHLKREIAMLEYQYAYLQRWLIAGGELTILGKRVEATLTWPDGRPYGLTDEQILEMIKLPPLPPVG
jgi:hypothetical protein